MGEVIEISIVSKEKRILYKFLEFIQFQNRENIIRKTIEVMDNWKYENVEIIESTELINSFLGKKLICITYINVNGQNGISIEPIDDLLLYNIWFNPTSTYNDDEYTKLINDFITFFSDSESIDDIIIGGVGKESEFRYLNDSKETINEAHNINVWFIDKIELSSDMLEHYKILSYMYSKDMNKEIVVLSKL